MESRPLVSVIIPVYNGAIYLSDALESVLSQTYPRFEVIVIDDGSGDNSASIARSFKDVAYIYQQNQGNAAARNHGIRVARGSVIAFLDQDDIWAENKLITHIDYMICHPEILYTTARFRYFLEPEIECPSWCRKELLSGDHVDYSPGSIVLRKEVFDSVGYFDTTYLSASDSDWFFRSKDNHVPMAILPEVLLYRRIHAMNQSAQTQLAHKELLRLTRMSIQRRQTRGVKNNGHERL